MTGSTTIEPMLVEKFREINRHNSKKIGQILATISVCLASLAAGSTLSWSSPCLTELEDVNSTTTFHISPGESSWVGSLLTIGALISSIPAGYCADQFGRRKSLLFIAIPFIISWGLIINASAVWMLFIGRFLSGLSVGAIFVIAPMYISEVTEDSLRGPLCALFALSICTGILITFIIATFANFTLISEILAIIPFVFMASFLLMPESPIYLLKISKQHKARKALQFFRGKHMDIDTELADMKKGIQNTNELKASFKDILTDKHYSRCLIACTLLFLFQQLSGINAVTFFTVPIFKASKSELDPIVASILVALVEVLVTILVFFIVDRHGRKSYVLYTSVVNCLSLAALGMSFHLMYYKVSLPGLTLVPLVSLMVFICSFSMGLGPIPWVVLAELLTPEIVGTISGIAIMVNWLSAFVVIKMFGPMMATLGPFVTFYILAVFNALCVLCVFFFVPETKGRTYQDIQSNW